ncbi:MAG: DUF4143 domain-containing protein [Muribaculum sp.]|nr:DUF4143 domain-containing protein [Muribaculum sp.]
MDNYLPRYIESTIQKKMKSSGVILVEGPKFCGKTTTSALFAKSEIRLNTKSAIQIARMEPYNVLLGQRPRLIDEWQTVPDLWNQARAWIDENPGFGQFIFTGSSTPVDKSDIFHSGAGRITRINMRPMSLFESRDSKGIVSLSSLFDNVQQTVVDMNDGYGLNDTAFLLCRGGWPLSLQPEKDVALDVTSNYFESLFNLDNSENPKFRNKNPEILRIVMRAFARHVSSQTSTTKILADITARDSRSISNKTFEEYADVLKDLFIIEDMEAWNPNLRSKTVVRSTPTHHFVDSSIAAQALGASPADMMTDLNTFGLLFEDMAVRDLRIYAQTVNGNVLHYRDSRGLECDTIVHLKDGRWAPIEIKLGGENLIEEGASNLIRLKSDIAEKHQPSFMMILTATGPAYRRDDGIYVVPINCLKA